LKKEAKENLAQLKENEKRIVAVRREFTV